MILHLIQYYKNHYEKIPKSTFLTLLSIFMYSLGYASIAFLPLYLNQTLHYSITTVGLFLSIFGVGSILSSYYGGKLCDRFSSYSVSIASIILYTIILIFAYFITQPSWLVAGLFFMLGVSSAAFSPASRMYLMSVTPVEEQGRINGLRYVLFNVGSALSFAMIAWVIKDTYKNIFLIAALFCTFASMIFFKLTPYKKNHSAIHRSLKIPISHNARFLHVILACSFLGLLVFAQLNSSYTLYLSGMRHFNTHELASLFLVNCLMIAFLQVSLLKSFKQATPFFLMGMGGLIMGLGFLILIFIHTYLVALISMILITFGEMLFMPTSQNLVYQSAREDLKGHYIGIYQALYASTIMLAPLLSSMILSKNANGIVLWSISFFICLIPLGCFFLHKYVFNMVNENSVINN